MQKQCAMLVDSTAGVQDTDVLMSNIDCVASNGELNLNSSSDITRIEVSHQTSASMVQYLGSPCTQAVYLA